MKPAAPRNAFWTLIRLEQAVAELADDGQRLPADAPAEHQDADPRVPGELRGEPQAVGDDRQLAPAAARLELAGDGQGRRAGVEHDALAVVDEGRARPPRCAAFSSAWSRSRISNASSGRLRSTAIAPPWVRTRRWSASSAIRSLRIVTAETPNSGRQVGHPGAAVLLDDPGDVLLSLAGEDVARGGAGWGGHASPLVRIGATTRGEGFRLISDGTVDRDRNAMSRR